MNRKSNLMIASWKRKREIKTTFHLLSQEGNKKARTTQTTASAESRTEVVSVTRGTQGLGQRSPLHSALAH